MRDTLAWHRLLHGSASRRLAVVVGTCLLFAGVTLALPSQLGAWGAGAPASANTYLVNSTADAPDGDPANPACSVVTATCTLRGAVQDANFAAGVHTITLPAGVYKLTRPGYDDNALIGDLDVQHDLVIQGAGSGATIVDGNGAVTGDRVFEVLPTASMVSLSGLTIRNGKSLSSTVGVIGGGGLYIEGAARVQLSDVIFEENTGQNGGGIFANFSTQGGALTLDRVTLHANSAIAGGVGAGGGAWAHLPSDRSAFVVRDSVVYSNSADGAGGGLYVDGNSAIQWSMQRSQVYSNTAASGAGIGNSVPLVLSDSRLHDNLAAFDGGGMETFAPYALTRTTLDSNGAGRFGGGIFDLQEGGSSSARFNSIGQSTMSGNYAQYGGGIYYDGFILPGLPLNLVNSTLSGNVVFRRFGATGSADGGGIYQYGGRLQLLNATVAGNRVQLGLGSHQYPGVGGGLYITASATFSAQNSIIANNTRGNGIIFDTADDCVSTGTVGTLAYDLIQNMTNCFVTGPQGGLIVNKDPLLGQLANNGGAAQTRALLAGSPAIDQGAPGGCRDDAGALLTIDQRGFRRPIGAGCDIGAFEYYPQALFLPHIRR